MTSSVLLLRRAEPALIPLINLTAALVLSALVVLATGADPIQAMIVLARGAASTLQIRRGLALASARGESAC